MKFALSILTLALSANVLATPTVEARSPTRVERDLASVTGVLSSISDKVGALHTSIKNYNGGNTQSVESASDTLVEAINSGTTKVKSTDTLNSMDALGLQEPVSNLKDKIQSTITDLKGKKKKLVTAGKGGVTLDDLKKQKSAALKLSDAIVSKVPDNLQDIAHDLSSGISDAIQKGIDDFQDVAKGNKVAKVPVATAPASESSSSSSAPCDCSDAAPVFQPKPTSSSLFGSTASTSSAAASSSGTPSSSSSPAFTGAASLNKISGPAGVVALAAVVMAF